MSATPGRSWRLGLILLPIALLALGAAYLWVVLNWSYSEGERAGYVQKFSRKGWFCKTWEGELAMVAIPGSLPEIFPFTAKDEAVAAQINALMGRRVSLRYQQHVGIPSTCFGETGYYVDQVHLVE